MELTNKHNPCNLTKGQIEQIIRWWIPSIILILKKQYETPVLHFRKLSLTAIKPWVTIGDTGICFPLEMTDNSSVNESLSPPALGFLMVMSAIEPTEADLTKATIDYCIQSAIVSVQTTTTHNNNQWITDLPPTHSLPKSQIEYGINSSIDSQKELNQIISPKDFTRPILIQQDTEELVRHKAHDLYLQSTCFAFLIVDQLNWQEGMFQKLNGAFVCIPSFYQLTTNQQNILRKDLKDPLPCVLVIGMKADESPPAEINQFLRPFPLFI